MNVPLPVPLFGHHVCPLWVHSALHVVLGLLVGLGSIAIYEHWLR